MTAALDTGRADRRTYTVQIGGMTCAACADRVARTLGRIDGVAATVNYATERASVVCPPDTDPRSLIEAVERAGYQARRVDHLPDAAADADGDSERAVRDLRRRLMVAAVLAVPLADLSLALSLFPELRFPGWTWVCLLLATPLVGWCAWPFHRAAWRGLAHRTSTMDTLVSLGVITATGWSLAMMVRDGPVEPGLGAGWSVLTRSDGALYLDVVAVVVTFLLAGRYFEARSKRRAASTMRTLLAADVRDVEVVRGDVVERMPPERLVVGDVVVVRPGQAIPADGEVLSGTASVDTSVVTGESTPRDVEPGAAVVGGTRNLDGLLHVRATRVGADGRLARMARLVERAQEDKARVQRLADRVCAVFVPTILLVAVATTVGWLVLDGSAAAAVTAGIAVLIVACPCALGLATPMAVLTSTGRGAELGLFIKGARALESTRAVDTVLFDKTGTLTEGRMHVSAVVPVDGVPAEELLRLAASVEQGSEHPIGAGIVAAASSTADVDDFTALPGRGVTGTVDGRCVAVGTARMLADTAVELPAELVRRGAALEATCATVVGVVADDRLLGLVALTDEPRPSAPTAISTLRAIGLVPRMLTGDNLRTAVAVAARVGLDPATEVTADASPEDKVAAVRALQAAGHTVALVGDGINDAAALAAADLGIAVGRGTDAAIDAADIVLGRDDLTAVAAAVELARRTHRTIRWNLVWAFGYNAAAVPLAAVGLLTPLVAGAAMVLSSVFVVSHSLALQRFRPPRARPATEAVG
ncbi:heavy metal translocating P-type ATPase [Pseudonocardia dioxanivorans CB1190]|uniref:Cation-transporting P-type ATPase B n=1 Tax=Pseudonocardia dioxanivorans (strain ATCC 55486 / DSM 44775 / JCM 13855 / CB1190) TaxID=675635 RepID=F4CXE4_PSEUX|nr:heavy metal translocating P-type ATPase [Pseudonocardia dioxanivorans]AEA26518.1 heavy metal translocating P-type ATPase [Pseudonocardia dioxanivorans CB1190]